ncbi:hypothetical protein JCM3766R1_001317 [Sporobolomyces carnicolor]
MTSHAPTSTSTHSRRRLSSRRLANQAAEGEGESSREASAESNDETTTSGQSDGELSSFAGTARPGLYHQPQSSSVEVDPLLAKHHGVTGGLGHLNLNPATATGTSASSPSNVAKKLATPAASGAAVAGGEASTTEGERDDVYEGGSASGHDGDISSAPAPSASLGSRLTSQQAHVSRAPIHLPPHHLHHHHEAVSSSTSTSPSPSISPSPSRSQSPLGGGAARGGIETEISASSGGKQRDTEGEVLWAAAPKGFLSNLSAQEIQDHIKSAIEGQAGRAYKINPPPVGRPVRIYADGVYDLLHYGHMLQLRQCKLAFPSVHLLVGCCSSELVREHKAQPVMHSEERYESLRHLKWVDEVVENAPWTVDKDFIDKWQIDYVAHDEEPYVSAGSEDVYAYAKSIGAFLPTKRTNGVSTSELLQRIVEGYREGDYDGKLRKIGHPELCSRQGSEAGTGYGGGSLRKE